MAYKAGKMMKSREFKCNHTVGNFTRIGMSQNPIFNLSQNKPHETN